MLSPPAGRGAGLAPGSGAGPDLSLCISELNSSGARGSSHSVHSLPGAQNAGCAAELPVASWAESFETLLQDRVAVTYFTVSARVC